MKIWCISDSHACHDQLNVPEVDMVIHAGDSTNYHDWIQNQPEFEGFITWFSNLSITHKVLIAGNHDAWATKKYNIDRLREAGIHYLEHEYVEIEGLKLFGSPYTPTFGEWHFMKDRGKLDKYWKVLEPEIDILITHGPPQGILDLSRSKQNILEYCGDKSLLNAVQQVKPKYHVFGHIHNFKDCINQGIRIIRNTTFINVSLVEDGKLGELSSNGIIIEI